MCAAISNQGESEMTNKAKLVLQGYFDLSDSDKQVVEDMIEQHKRAVGTEKRASVRKSFESQGRITLGPVSTGCPCCGR
jgi:hypothetical protein